MKLHLTLLFLLTIFITSSCKVGGSNPSSTGSSINWPSNDMQAKWSTSNFPLNVQLSSDFTNDELELIGQMEDNWNDSADLNFFRTPASTTPNLNYGELNSFHDGTIGVYKSYDWYSDSIVSSDALAITQYFGLRINGGTPGEYLEMNHADIIINYRHFHFSLNPDFGSYDLPSVVLHELGHVLGLKHENDYMIDSVMQPYILSQVRERELYVADEIAVNENYTLIGMGSATAKNAIPIKREVGEVVRGIIELRSDGSCIHHQF